MSSQDNRNQRPGTSNSEDESWTSNFLPGWCSNTNSKNSPSETASNNRSPNANFAATAATEEDVEIQFSNDDAAGNKPSPWNLFHVLSCATANRTTLSDTSSTCRDDDDEGNSDTESVDFLSGYINSMETFLAASQEKTIQMYKRKIPPKVQRVTMAGTGTDLDTSMETIDSNVPSHSDKSAKKQLETIEKVEITERKFIRKIPPKVERVTMAGTIDTDGPSDEFVMHVKTVEKVERSDRKREDEKTGKKKKKVPKKPLKKKKLDDESDGRKKRGLWWKFLGLVGLSIVIYLISHFVSKSSSSDKNVNYSSSPDNSENTTAKPVVTDDPTKTPTETPTESPSSSPTASPSTSPSVTPATYIPGKLNVRENGLRLSEGLQSRIVARSGERVELKGLSNSGQVSEEKFHMRPDGAGVFEHPETGGWAYVSNAEVLATGGGGVGAIYFDKDGQVMDYRMLLKNTTHNCAGGKTPWNTWVSCEEFDRGSAFQVDPFSTRPPQETTLGIMRKGAYESFAYDIRNKDQPRFYVTEDSNRGAMRRWTPDDPNWDDPWNILHKDGSIDYLVLNPTDKNWNGGTYSWTTDLQAARANALLYYKNTEGIDVSGNQLFVVAKNQKDLFILDLDAMTYERHSTVSGIFDGMPDQMQRLTHGTYDLLYFCEEAGANNGVHARDTNGWFFTILESAELNDETTGLDFSPDGKHLYVSFQEVGLIYDITREDGLPFHGRTLDVRYHQLKIQ